MPGLRRMFCIEKKKKVEEMLEIVNKYFRITSVSTLTLIDICARYSMPY